MKKFILMFIFAIFANLAQAELVYTDCSCSDQDGGYKRSCYSTNVCGTCCCLGLDKARGCGAASGTKPGVGGKGIAVGYEKTVGTILAGTPPLQAPTKVESRRKAQ